MSHNSSQSGTLLWMIIAALIVLNVFQLFRRTVEDAPDRSPSPPAPGSKRASIESDEIRRDTVSKYSNIVYQDPSTWYKNRWLGVQALQNPNDAWIIQEIIVETRPDFIIETGTFHGGSAMLWAMILKEVNPEARVITIDIEDQASAARKSAIASRSVDFMIGSSVDPALVSEISDRVKGKKTMVILDSDHSRDHVLKELKAYSPLVSAGSYLIVQDTAVNGHPIAKDFGPGPWEAVEEFLLTSDLFEIDHSRERMLHTLHPSGYLRRKP